MAKHIRYVHPVDMVAHLWANQSQDSRAISAETSTSMGIRSIATGALSHRAARGNQARPRGAVYHPRLQRTTTGHKWTVEGACRHLTVFHVQDPTSSDRKGQFAEYRQRYVELARKYSRRGATSPGFSAVCATRLPKLRAASLGP